MTDKPSPDVDALAERIDNAMAADAQAMLDKEMAGEDGGSVDEMRKRHRDLIKAELAPLVEESQGLREWRDAFGEGAVGINKIATEVVEGRKTIASLKQQLAQAEAEPGRLRKLLLRAEDIVSGKVEPSGTEPEEIQPLAEHIYRLRGKLAQAEAERERMRGLVDYILDRGWADSGWNLPAELVRKAKALREGEE